MFHLVGGCACSCTELGGRLLRRLVFLCSSLCLTVYRRDPQSQPLIEKKIKYFSGDTPYAYRQPDPPPIVKKRDPREHRTIGGEADFNLPTHFHDWKQRRSVRASTPPFSENRRTSLLRANNKNKKNRISHFISHKNLRRKNPELRLLKTISFAMTQICQILIFD